MRNFLKSLWSFLKGIFGGKTEESEFVTYTTEPIRETKQIETDILNLINQYRVSNNLAELLVETDIKPICTSHNLFMIKEGLPSHDGFVNRINSLMANHYVINVGEIIAYGYATPEGCLNGWKKSESHNSAMLKKIWTHFNMSAELDSNNRYYYTVIFIQKTC